MPNPIQNPAQARTAEHYITYLECRLWHAKQGPMESVPKIEKQLVELRADLVDYNKNIKVRLVVDNNTTA